MESGNMRNQEVKKRKQDVCVCVCVCCVCVCVCVACSVWLIDYYCSVIELHTLIKGWEQVKGEQNVRKFMALHLRQQVGWFR